MKKEIIMKIIKFKIEEEKTPNEDELIESLNEGFSKLYTNDVDNIKIEQIEILIKKCLELKSKLKKQQYSGKEIYKHFCKSNSCNHQVRQLKTKIDDDDWFSTKYLEYDCVFCGHSISANKSNQDWFYERYYNNCVFIEDENIDVYKLILKILQNKKDDENIDFVEEFKKLNLDSSICTIADKKQQNNIMIIDSIDKDIDDTLILLDYLSKIDGIRVRLFSRKIYRQDHTIFKIGYSFPKKMKLNDQYCIVDELEKDEQNHIPYKLIINLADMEEYEVERIIPACLLPHNCKDNNTYKIEKPDFEKIKEMFPNSIITDIKEINEETIKSLLTTINKLTNCSLNQDEEYDNVSSKVKKLTYDDRKKWEEHFKELEEYRKNKKTN